MLPKRERPQKGHELFFFKNHEITGLLYVLKANAFPREIKLLSGNELIIINIIFSDHNHFT